MTQQQHIVVGLSGGVDSAVTALLLKQQGHDVSGVFMQNWQVDQDDPHCTAEQDLSDARTVCDQLHIPFHVVNFSKRYWDRVFQTCLDEFAAGRTPNPDIWCNKEIKFNALLDHAKQLGGDYLATGHYADISKGSQYCLHKGADNNKDQSYFLYTLNQQQLQHALFPLGQMHKTAVRLLAEQHGLINHDKKDSTGICFIGERKFKSFLQEFLLAQPGEMRTPEGKFVGNHDGIMFYTLGQRKGLNIGGHADFAEQAWYVVDKDINNNTLIVAQGDDHPLLFQRTLRCNDLHWVAGVAPSLPLNCCAKIRYRQQEQPCIAELDKKDTLSVTFEQPQRAITPGQAIVFYDVDRCLGGGTICSE